METCKKGRLSFAAHPSKSKTIGAGEKQKPPTKDQKMKRVNKFLAILLMAGLCGNGTVGAVRITPKGQHAGLNGFDDKKAYTNGEQIVTSFKGNNPYKPKSINV